mmetsp:Transcript_14315/g.47018  ORF Transcript_14315/g.47018 Transcript_14315/m.47018 type:complete len:268 (+) Transcript_14315:2160-2963(+)
MAPAFQSPNSKFFDSMALAQLAPMYARTGASVSMVAASLGAAAAMHALISSTMVASSTILEVSSSSASAAASAAAAVVPAARRSVRCARDATWRHSGSATSSTSLLRPGRSLGRKGAASVGSSTSLHMLSMMTADLRLMATFCVRSRPRWRSGPIMESVGDSTVWTNVVAASLCTHSGTSSMLVMHSMSVGMNGSISMLPTTVHTWVIVDLDFSTTSAFMLVMQSDTSGMMVGRQAATWRGAVSVSVHRMSRPATTAPHCCERRPAA